MSVWNFSRASCQDWKCTFPDSQDCLLWLMLGTCSSNCKFTSGKYVKPLDILLAVHTRQQRTQIQDDYRRGKCSLWRKHTQLKDMSSKMSAYIHNSVISSYLWMTHFYIFSLHMSECFCEECYNETICSWMMAAKELRWDTEYTISDLRHRKHSERLYIYLYKK